MTKETSMSSIQERVAKGAAWLDQVRPGWRDAISLELLDLGSFELCVLGQAFADDLAGEPTGFARACGINYQCGQPHGGVAEMGFNMASETPIGPLLYAEKCALVAEWRRVIHQSLPVADHAPTRETSNVG